MKSGRTVFLVLSLALAAGCGGGGSSGGGGNSPAAPSPPLADNVLLVTVNGSLCAGNSDINKACVSVTVCAPGSNNCETINDILLDTGSFGFRVFRQALSFSLPQVAAGSGSLAECVQFADGTADWGPVQTASVRLGNEPAVQVPIQVIDASFGAVPPACGNAHQSPSAAGYTGILGVGLFVHDCGPECVDVASNGMYYSCNGSNCSGTTVPLENQVQNPVALLPADNNGVIVQLPGVPAGGAPSVNGALVLGIGTRSNNMPSGVTAYPANSSGDIPTIFNGTSYTGFIDSGSNGLFFSTSQFPDCPSPNSGWFCPPSPAGLSATNTGKSGSPSGVVSFQVANFDSLLNSSNRVFNDAAGSSPDLSFDWGIPFFLGRNVWVGFQGMGSSLGTGPYWAY